MYYQLYLEHRGTPHEGMIPHSGRYPYGSGEAAYQRAERFYKNVQSLRKQGMSDSDIARSLGFVDKYGKTNMTEFSHKLAVTRQQKWTYDSITAQKLRDLGYSNTGIAKKMGLSSSGESQVRNWLDPELQERNLVIESTAKMIKEQVDKYGYIDVGKGAEYEIPTYAGLGIKESRLQDALYLLKEEGYEVYNDIKVQQVTNPRQFTTFKVICPPGTTKGEVYKHARDIHSLTAYSRDEGLSYQDTQFPSSIDSNRVQVRYDEDGGSLKDGIIEIRRGVKDLDLGPNSHYAQVRIAVDGTHYLKGVAIYSDDMPDGVDVIFNSNKSSSTPKMDCFKELKKDPVTGEVDKILPFGSTIKAGGQDYYEDPDGSYIIDGKRKSLSAINKVYEEGDWNKWSKTISSQFLSKQRKEVVQHQLDETYKQKVEQLRDIQSITNDTIRKQQLLDFSEDLDAAAVHLKAVGFPRQRSQLILPCDISEKEVYAPNFENGEEVILVRHPYAGYFESPRLIVNNRNPSGKDIVGNGKDAIGINPHTAALLSGADFDGDTVIVIPTRGQLPLRARESVKGNEFSSLVGFDTKKSYPGYEGMKVISKRHQQTQMGEVSNLITDMTLIGAPPEHIEKAVKYSMVIIDAYKHKLDYKKAYKDYDIKNLKALYQGRYDEYGKFHTSASTLISRAKGMVEVNERKEWYAKVATEDSPYGIDPKTGEKLYSETGRTIKTKLPDGSYGEIIDKKTGQPKLAKERSTKMAEAKDARGLSSGHVVEEVYADYANKLKSLANETRKLYLQTPETKSNESAKKTYVTEVESLKAKLLTAMKNAPKERLAQVIANAIYKSKVEDNPAIEDDKELEKKVRSRALAEARANTGANKQRIFVTEKEWEAIQAGAIGSTMLKQIMANCESNELMKYAMPSKTVQMTPGQRSRIRSYINMGYSASEIASALGISISTVYNFAEEDGKDIAS